MRLNLRMSFAAIAVCAIVSLASSVSRAGTIIKLNLGGVGPDVGMNAAGSLSTASDGDGATTGDQNTAVEFTGFLDVPFADINTPIASFSLNNLLSTGPAQVFNAGTLVIQNFFGGTFNLYDQANVLLLSGALTNSALAGAVGPPGTGGLFTTGISTVTGGTLQPYIQPGSLTLSMNFSTVNGGLGFSVGPGGPVLNPFLADAAVNISADPNPVVPEPAALMLVLMGAAAGTAFGRRRVR